MSTRNPPHENCQAAATKIKAVLEPFFAAVERSLQHAEVPLKISIRPSQLALFLAAWPGQNKPLTVMVPWPPGQLQAFHRAVSAWADLLGIKRPWHALPGALSDSELAGEIVTPASRALHALLQTQASPIANAPGFIISHDSLSQPVPDPAAYRQACLYMAVGETRSMQAFTKQLAAAGYVRHQSTLERGGFRVVGETVDIAHPWETTTYRLTWYGSSIERIIARQNRRQQEVSHLTLPPLKFPAQTANLLFLLAVHDVIASANRSATISPLITFDNLQADIEFPFRVSQSGQKPASPATILFYANYDRARAWAARAAIPQPLLCPHPLAHEQVHLTSQTLQLISEASAIAQTAGPRTSASPISDERARMLIGELTVGKPAVHADHGIGIFEGLQSRTINRQEREYIVLRYAAGDAVSTPVEFAHKVTPYLGQTHPTIHRLGGTLWQKTRRQAQHDAVAFAQELLAINRARVGRQRSAYGISPTDEATLNDSFPFTLTSDQERTWEEIKQDMEKSIPMDRLIVGDVGFGKTEIAIRAAYHAVKSGRQVAVIAPTTLLVQQHTDTFRQRLPRLAGQILALSRLVSSAQQKQTKADIKSGQGKIIIGTHALLNKSITWHNLGLAIVDEEQRFGVRHKEHLKAIRAHLDVLSLSATPIPRTLSMALSGLRQLSLIQTPPPNRLDVKTHVGKIDEAARKHALERELSRGGQAYIVAPKIRQLPAIKEHISALLPEARLAVAHGQMDEKQLADIIHAFDSHELDILITSSIIEHGLDLPLTNTLIVWDCLRFGLADLYQLRGRIGRRQTQGYAYFFYNQAELTSIQRQRLAALVSSQRLGSGWLIAQRDLEIRGAGNLLGRQQHGVTNAVGIQLYLDLLNQAVEEHDMFTREVKLELPLPAALPAHYIADMAERTRWYQRLSRSRSLEELQTATDSLIQTYGPLPLETSGLILLIKLQRVAAAHNITFIGSKTITPPDENPYERLEVSAQNLPAVLPHLAGLGNWRLRGDKATLDVDKVMYDLVSKLINTLQ